MVMYRITQNNRVNIKSQNDVYTTVINIHITKMSNLKNINRDEISPRRDQIKFPDIFHPKKAMKLISSL